MIDFSEIPSAKEPSKFAEAFELFARDFLESLGFQILKEPARGSDGGIDLLVGEKLGGIFATADMKWVVSAKHKTSGKAIGRSDEQDPTRAARRTGANGFIAFYSTVPTEDLRRELKEICITEKLELKILDCGLISKYLINDPRLAEVFANIYLSTSNVFASNFATT